MLWLDMAIGTCIHTIYKSTYYTYDYAMVRYGYRYMHTYNMYMYMSIYDLYVCVHCWRVTKYVERNWM